MTHLPRSTPVRAFAGAALPSILSQPLAQPSKSSARRKCYVSERASNNSTGSGALGVVFPEIEPVCLQGSMRVSIIVPTLNEESHIVGTIRTLQRLSSEKEIIVVDGGSTDQTASLACAQNVLVLEAPQGRGIQMHVGALESTGDVLWFLHADTIPPPHALEYIRKSLEASLQSVVISACCSMAHRVLPGSLLPSTRCCASLVYATAIQVSLSGGTSITRLADSVHCHFSRIWTCSGDCAESVVLSI